MATMGSPQTRDDVFDLIETEYEKLDVWAHPAVAVDAIEKEFQQ